MHPYALQAGGRRPSQPQVPSGDPILRLLVNERERGALQAHSIRDAFRSVPSVAAVI